MIEDEVHKRDELIQCVLEVYSFQPEVVDSVRSAVLKVMECDYDLIILDMALPTFGESSLDKIKGHDQAQGGIEVLRVLKLQSKSPKIIIVTQYPDFYIGPTKVKLKDAGKTINEKYNQNVLAGILYQYKSKATLQKIMSLLKNQK
ncbi:response regulator [Hydrogenophaga sp.]|uniref:response regulator n=1 Tax=Hydrogenophaga sp. TaxID=1904254 RepID=UPI00391D3AD6